MSQDEYRDTGPHRETLGSSFAAHTGDTGAAFEQRNASPEDPDEGARRKRRRRFWIVLAVVALLAIFIVYRLTSPSSSKPSAGAVGGRGQQGPAAITTAETTTGNMNVYVDCLLYTSRCV